MIYTLMGYTDIFNTGTHLLFSTPCQHSATYRGQRVTRSSSFPQGGQSQPRGGRCFSKSQDKHSHHVEASNLLNYLGEN